MVLHTRLGERGYDIQFCRGALSHLSDFTNLNRKVMLVTDEGVPQVHVNKVAAQLSQGTVFTAPQGEGAKSFSVYEEICRRLLKQSFSRRDLIIALGGGVVGDLAGFAADVYKRQG